MKAISCLHMPKPWGNVVLTLPYLFTKRNTMITPRKVQRNKTIKTVQCIKISFNSFSFEFNWIKAVKHFIFTRRFFTNRLKIFLFRFVAPTAAAETSNQQSPLFLLELKWLVENGLDYRDQSAAGRGCRGNSANAAGCQEQRKSLG